MPKLNKKIAIAVSAAAIVAIGGGTAFAYWTTTGSGNGSAVTGTTSATTTMTIAQSASVTGLVLGGPAGTVNVKVTNPAAYSQSIGQIAATPTYPATCGAANWTITPLTNGPTTLAAGVTSGDIAVATVALNDLASTDQNGCKDATVTFAFTG